MQRRVSAALAVGLLALLALVALSGGAGAQAGGVEVEEQNKSVVEGSTVGLDVILPVGDEPQEVRVSCTESLDRSTSSCPVWSTTVNEDDGSCRSEGQSTVCTVEFPADFPAAPSQDSPPEELGEPARAGTWTVGAGPTGTEDRDTFEAHLTTGSTCYDGFYRRGETLLIGTSGHEAGADITARITDLDRGEVVFEETRTDTNGPQVVYDFVWRPSLDYPLGSDDANAIEIKVTSDGKQDETEQITLRPGMARATIQRGPGTAPVDTQYDRTQTVEFHVEYEFPRRPSDCLRVAVPPSSTGITEDQIEGPVRANVNQVTETGDTEDRSFEDSADGELIAGADRIVYEYVIPRDTEATDPGDATGPPNPTYELRIPETELTDGNLLGEVNSTRYEVDPYIIEPEFIELQEDVERLEAAEVVVNLTYADGSAFEPEDASSQMRIAWGPEDEDDGEVNEMELEHQVDGRWNASVPLDFDYEPLGDYTWRVQENEDTHGEADSRNQIARGVSDVVEVVGARPVIDMETFVAGEAVNGTERTRTVHVTLNAEYKNGVPLTEDNVDPQAGGIELNIHKRNEFGRVVATDNLVMTPVNDQGDWVRSFRIERTPSQAPVGDWDLEIVASDDNDPPNVNETRFDFEVRPAQLEVSPRVQPPALVDDDTEDVEYVFRITYPDGTLLTQSLVEQDRGGQLDVNLERVRGVGEQPSVERTLEPRGQQGGATWSVSVAADKIVPGNHYYNVSGRDVHGNVIGPDATSLFTVVFNGEYRNSTTPICPRLEPGETCEIERGEEALAIFPGSEGDKGMVSDQPQVFVLRQVPDDGRWLLHRSDVLLSSEEFANRTGEDPGNNHVGFFETDASTPRGRYQLFIEGRAQDDTGFVGYSQPFNVTPIRIDRPIVEPLPDSSPKQERLSGAIERQPGDVIDAAVARAGAVTSRAVEVTPAGERAFVSWTPDRSAPSGPATIELEGRDVFGNLFEATLGPVELRPMDVSVDVVEQPDPTAERGLTTSMVAELTFEDGARFRPVHGEPDVLLRDSTGARIDEGDALFSQGRWTFTWEPPPSLDEGRYVMEIGGQDGSGNQIETSQSETLEVVPGRVSGSTEEEPDGLRRGEVAEATFDFGTEIQSLEVVVTTGTSELGQAQVQVEDGTVEAQFPSTRDTTLAEVFFQVSGQDAFGNSLTARTSSFQIDPMLMDVRFVTPPPNEAPLEEPVVTEFVVEYPDGSRMRPGEGSPLVGLFLNGEPQGTVENVEPREDDPTVWRVEWEPPEDARTGLPYNFGVSAIDNDQNEAPPVSSNGFVITNPVVPDYLPTPAPGLGAVVAALATALALAGHRW